MSETRPQLGTFEDTLKQYTPLTYKFATMAIYRIKDASVGYEDCQQMMALALHRAWQTYDPTKGAGFMTHAWWTLQGQLYDLTQKYGKLRYVPMEAPEDMEDGDSPEGMVPDPNANTEEEAMQREVLAQLELKVSQRCMEYLRLKITPPEHLPRPVTDSAIARVMGVSETQVSEYAQRIKKAVRGR